MTEPPGGSLLVQDGNNQAKTRFGKAGRQVRFLTQPLIPFYVHVLLQSQC